MSHSASSACAARYILLDNRVERFSNQRYCMVLGALLAQRLGRTLVAPAYARGEILDPPFGAAGVGTDYFDFFAPPPRLCTVRLRRFLSDHPLSRHPLNGKWLPGARNFSLQEMAALPSHVRPTFQHERFKTNATVLLLRELGTGNKRHSANMCWRFSFFQSSDLYTELARPASSVSAHLPALRAAVAPLGAPLVAAHWRTMTTQLMFSIQDNRSWVQTLGEHLRGCAEQLSRAVTSAVAERQGVASRPEPPHIGPGGAKPGVLPGVLLFSDLDESYDEFSSLPLASAQLYTQASNATHRLLLAQPGWRSGDEIVKRVLKARGGDALSLYPMLLQDLLVSIPTQLVTCSSKSCARCARHDSAFTRNIVEARRTLGLATTVKW